MDSIVQGILATFSDVNALIRFAVLYIFVVWISVIIWVIKDITHRTDNIVLQVVSVLTVLVFTPLGICIYLLIRPQKTLFERLYEREFRDLAERPTEPKETGAQKKVREKMEKSS